MGVGYKKGLVQEHVMIYRLNVKTHAPAEFQDLTDRVNDAISKSGVEEGICLVYVPHTTAGVTINEHADPDVADDMIARLEAMVPKQGSYKHVEGNSAAHIKASLIGSSVTAIVQYGELALGTWQGIFFCEFDGPRNREVHIKVISDKE
jgi:secondary thiamine-phosphate synthase enzyme